MSNTPYSSHTAPSTVYENCSTSIPSFRNPPASHEQQIIISVAVSVLGVWSIIGNILTILAISLHKNMRTKVNMFILSLAVSDLISATIASPLWIYRRTWGFYPWEWGDFLCHLFWFSDESTSYCTALHIASFAVLRLIGVKKPIFFKGIKKRTIIIFNGILWTLALIFGGFLYTSFFEVAEKPTTGVSSCWPMCSIRISYNGVYQHKIYYTFSSTTFLFIPMLILFTASALIVRELHTNHVVKSQKRKDKERKAAFQLALIAGSFLFGYVPLTTYVLLTTRAGFNCSADYWFNVAAFFTLRLSECLNPLIYNLASKKMRTASRNILAKLCTPFRYVKISIKNFTTTEDSKTPNHTAIGSSESEQP